jgi:hypothetical protein
VGVKIYKSMPVLVWGHDKGENDMNEGNEKLNAWNDLQKELKEGETVEAIVFGNWGWASNSGPDPDGYEEPDPKPVPMDMRGKVLTPEEAKPLMDGWSFNGGYGAPDCYAVRIWTNERILFVTQYDGATGLDSTARNPIDHWPDMPGG